MPGPLFEIKSPGLIRAKDLFVVPKVWGEEKWIVNNDKYCGKRLLLFQGMQCSLHHHKIKHETFYIVGGKVRFELDDEVYILTQGDSIEVPVGTRHRFGGLVLSVIMEFSTHHEESDSYREEGELSRFNPDLLESPE